MFMGFTLAARMAVSKQQPDELGWIVKQHALFAQHLQDSKDGLYYHGFNNDSQSANCCKWGRVNGWIMMAHAELLLALEALNVPKTSSEFVGAVSRLELHAKGMFAHQSPDGRFYQVINESSTFLETSGSAMTVFAMATALQADHQWLPRAQYLAPLQKAWTALATKAVDQSSGNITGVCTGTCIADTLAYYEARSTSYWGSSNGGVGSLLRAAAAMARLQG